MGGRILGFLLALLLLAVTVSPAPAAPAEPTVTLTVDQGPFTVGDPIHVRIEVRYPEGATVTPPSLGNTLGPFETQDQPRTNRTPEGDGTELLTYEFTVAAFQTGSLVLPPLEFIYAQPGVPTQTLASEPTLVTVNSVLPQDSPPQDIQGLKPQAELPVPGPPILQAAAGLGALAAAAVTAAYMLHRRRGRPPKPVPVPRSASGPEEAAAAELDRIAGLGLIERGAYKELYLLVAGCVRRYLTERYGFPAFALTTTELRAWMDAQGMDRWQARLVDGLLTECDEVIYAQYVPARERVEGDLSVAYEIVAMTRVHEEPLAEATA